MKKRDASRQTGFLLQRAHRRLRLAHGEALRHLDLGIAHIAVMGLLAERGDLSQRQLIELMDADKSTMVYLIDQLEKQALAERRDDPQDRRAYAVHLTQLGRQRLAEAGEIVRRVEDRMLAPLSSSERKTLDDLLSRIGEHAKSGA
ncbi:MAG TPA: MarR family transcriptional regulator [Gemmatimonadaceae bacterium]|jgi:DNA-binding MarR family transcriptional regulator|nr:MarR family transcriptional regulator [Gemmatimonadaceae bacterium]